MVANELAGGIFQALHTADINPDRGIIFQRAAARGDFGVAVDDAHFFTQLVDEDANRVGLADDAGQLTHGLAHQAGLQAHMAVAHLALDLGTGNHSGHRVHHNGVDGTGAHQCLTDLHGLLAGIRLTDQQLVDVHAQRLGIGRVQCVLDIDKGHFAALFLGFGQDMEGQRGLTTGFRSKHLDNTAAGHTAHAQRQVQAQAARGDGIHLHGGVVAQLHDGALAKLLFDLGQGSGQRVFLCARLDLLGGRSDRGVLIFRHRFAPLLSKPVGHGRFFSFLS